MLKGKVLVAQGGGPTAVINESMVGAVIESRKFAAVERVYGAHYGVRGIVDEEFLDLTQETAHNLELVAGTPCSALGSTRDKPDLKYCQEIFKVLKAHGIETFFYIGGNDSSDTLRIVSEQARKNDYPMRCIHIPKTVDNDLAVNDHTPGYPSAARFVALAFAGVNADNRALPGVYIAVVMGRHAGYLTAASALGRKFEDDGPHLIYLPERPFIVDKFVSDVKECHDKFGRCIIAVAEGIHDGSGKPIISKWSTRSSATPTAMSSFPARRLGRPAVRHRQEAHQHPACARRYLRLPAALIPGCVSDVDQREPAKSARRPCSTPTGATATGR